MSSGSTRATFPKPKPWRRHAGACGSVAYTVIPAFSGARRLAWRSSAGGIEHYTFPIEKSESAQPGNGHIRGRRASGRPNPYQADGTLVSA